MKSGVGYSVNIFLAVLCDVTVLACNKEKSSLLFFIICDWRGM